MCVRLVIEGPHLAVSAAPVEGLRLGQGLVGLEPEQRYAPFPRQGLELLQDTFSNPQAAGRRGAPHALDLPVGGMALERTASDRLAMQRGQDEKALRGLELRRRRGHTE